MNCRKFAKGNHFEITKKEEFYFPSIEKSMKVLEDLQPNSLHYFIPGAGKNVLLEKKGKVPICRILAFIFLVWFRSLTGPCQ